MVLGDTFQPFKGGVSAQVLCDQMPGSVNLWKRIGGVR